MNVIEHRDEEKRQIVDIKGAPMQHVPATGDAASLMAVISRAASDPRTDVDKLERLMSMYERIQANQAREAFAAALAAVKREIPQVRRDKYNSQTQSRYASLEQLDRQVSPIASKHGFTFSYSQGTAEQPNHYRIICTMMHEAGHEQQSWIEVPIDSAGIKGTVNKTPTHAFGSTMSYGRRYAKLMALDLATSDDDDGNRAGSGATVSEEQLATIRELIDETGADTERFCQFFKIDALPDLPAAKFDDAIKALKAKRAK